MTQSGMTLPVFSDMHLPDESILTVEHDPGSFFRSSSSYHGFHRKETGRRDPMGVARSCIQSSDQDD